MQRQHIPPSGFYYTNNIGRTFIQAIEETIGKERLSALLREYGLDGYVDNYPPANFERGFDFADMSTLSAALDDLEATQDEPDLGYRVGRATFKGGLQIFGGMGGAGGMVLGFRTISQNLRIKMGLQMMATIYNTFTDQQTEVVEYPDHYAYIITRCSLCIGRQADHAICAAALGLLQEGLRWSTEREYRVEETTCCARGDEACTFAIYKDSH